LHYRFQSSVAAVRDPRGFRVVFDALVLID
jgi:hypothetical protein